MKNLCIAQPPVPPLNSPSCKHRLNSHLKRAIEYFFLGKQKQPSNLEVSSTNNYTSWPRKKERTETHQPYPSLKEAVYIKISALKEIRNNQRNSQNNPLNSK